MSEFADANEWDIELLRERIAQGDETAWVALHLLATDLKRDDLVDEVDRRIAKIVASARANDTCLDIPLLVDLKHGSPSAIPAELQPTVSVLAEIDGGFGENHEAPLSDLLRRYLRNLKDDEYYDDTDAPVLPEGETFWSYFLRKAELANHVTADGVGFSSPDVDRALLDGYLSECFEFYPTD